MPTRKHWQPLQVPQHLRVSETHGQWCTFRDIMHKVRAEPVDRKTTSALVRLGRGQPSP